MSLMLDLFQAVTGVFVVVYDGQHALRFTLGRAGAVVGPGIHFKFPIIQNYKVRETKHTTLDLDPQVIQLKDDLVYEVDAKLVYQIVDLRKAMIEVDDIVQGLRNRVAMAIQRVVKAQDRESIRNVPRIIATVREELMPIEAQWGVYIHEFGFSNLSPSPATLEVTQLRLLSDEKLRLYRQFIEQGLKAEAAVALIAGAVVTVPQLDGAPPPAPPPKPPPPPTPGATT